MSETIDYLASVSEDAVSRHLIEACALIGRADDRTPLNTAALELIDFTHGMHAQLGWWTDPQTMLSIQRHPQELLALCHSEVSEALEGDRKSLLDDKLTDRPMLEVELVDCAVRLADMAGGLGLRAETAFLVLVNANGLQREYDRELERVPVELDNIHRELAGPLDSLPSVIARSLLRCFILGDRLALQMPLSYWRKLVVNSKRADHKLANRALAGGKRY